MRKVLMGALCVLLSAPAAAAPKFNGYEIRVITPRKFTKARRLELTGGLATIVNQSFVYTFVATGLATWHFTETLALEGQFGYGRSVDRRDMENLDQSFGIKTIILRPETLANARLVWTPAYGKFHLNAERILHFETHVTAGAGLTGIRHRYDHCEDPADLPPEVVERDDPEPAPTSRVVQYPTGVLGVGQRYFTGRDSSLRLGFEAQRVYVNTADSNCTAGAPGVEKGHNNLLLFLGWSVYL